MSIHRAFVNLLVPEPRAVAPFYQRLLGWTAQFESDWFVHLQAPGKPDLELGLLQRDHAIVPEAQRAAPQGVLVTVVVPDVDAVHARAVAQGVPVVEAPRDLFYGQRRMLVRDPVGTLLDISSECAPSPEFLASLG